MPSQDCTSFNVHSKQHGDLRPQPSPHRLVYKQSVEDYFFDRSPSVSRRSLAGSISFNPVQRANSTGSSIRLKVNQSVNPQVYPKNEKSPESRKESSSKREFLMGLRFLPLTVTPL